LRRDGRPATWPARAFLPSHGTFIRRLEMLRNASPIGSVSLPLPARMLTIATLAAVGLGIAGVRGPASESAAPSQTQQTVQSDPTARTETSARADQAARPEGASSNLAYLPADAKMVLAIRPGSLLSRRDVRSLLKSMRQGPSLLKALFIPPEDVEQLLVFWEGMPVASGQPGPSPMIPSPSGFVLRTA